jgi:hypothetical protein
MKRSTKDGGVIQLGRTLQLEKVLSYDEFNQGDGPQRVVCLRWSDGPAAVPSQRDVCARCLAAVWVSRSTQEAVQSLRQPLILCAPCATAELQQDHAGGEAGP